MKDFQDIILTGQSEADEKAPLERIAVSTVRDKLDEEVLIKGWVHQIRALGNLAFLLLRDRSGLVQVVLEGELAQLDLPLESAISLVGVVNEDERAPNGVEVRAKSLAIIAPALEPVPFELNKNGLKAGMEVLLDHRTISLRHPRNRAIFKVQDELLYAFRQYLRFQDFTEIHTPKLVSTGVEGGTELFEAQYFEKKAYLAQSPQFYKQMMVGAGLERVYEVGPVFRAEEHNTSRHLNEYVSLDVEIGFIRDEEELMDLEESLLRFVFLHLADSCQEELRLFGVQAPDPYRIPRLPLAEAQALLRQEYKKTSPPGNLDPEGERLLSEYIRKKHRSDFVFITHYPVKKRPFYAMPREDDPQLTRSFDLLYNGLEVTTGGQRIHIYDKLVANLDRFGLNPSNFAHYLEVFKFGMPPHGGFAIGLERLTARLLGLDNVREASLFPRDRNRLAP